MQSFRLGRSGEAGPDASGPYTGCGHAAAGAQIGLTDGQAGRRKIDSALRLHQFRLMAKRRIKFIWGSGDQIPGEWTLGVWGVYERDPGSRVKGLAVSARGLLRWALGGALATYLVGATALWTWFGRNPYNQITFADTLLLPLRWSHVRETRGKMMIEEGMADLKAKRWAEAAMKLRVGLDRAPHDRRGRLALAQFKVLANQRPAALTLLREDWEQGYPGRSYLETLFTLAAEGEDYDVILAACDRFAKAAPADAVWLKTQQAQALVHAGRPEETVRIVDLEGDGADELLKEGKVLALLELKRAPEAVSYLERWRREPRANPAQVVRLQVRAYREAGRLPEMAGALEEFRQLAPTDPRASIYGIVQRALAGQMAAATTDMDRFFLRFASSNENLALLAGGLAEAKVPVLVQRCVDEGAVHGFRAMPLYFALLQAQLATGDGAGAARTFAKLGPLANRRDPTEKFLMLWMEQLVGAVSHTEEAPQAGLLEFLQQRSIPMRIYRLTCEPLVLAGRFATAQKVLELAEHSYPGSRTLAGLRAQVEAGLKPAPAAVVAVQPSATVLREKALFAELESLRSGSRWADVAEVIRKIRVAKPAWLAARESDILDWQMNAAVQLGDTPELLNGAKFFLDGSGARAARVVSLAQAYSEKGRRSDAELLLAEVLRKSPNFPPATRLLKAWHPVPPPPAGAKPKG